MGVRILKLAFYHVLTAHTLIIMTAPFFSLALLMFSALLLALFALPPLNFLLYNLVLLFPTKTRSLILWCHG